MPGLRDDAKDRGPHHLQTTWLHAVWPAVVGLAFCGLCVWPAMVYWHNQATFQARAVRVRATIDQIYSTGPFPPAVGNGGPFLNEDGLVHFQVQERTAHARVVLVSDCSGACLPVYRVGQVLTVYYNPQNLTYAQLSPPSPPNLIGFAFGFSLFALVGLTLLAAAVINAVAAQDSWQVKRAKKVRSPARRPRAA